jgi:hypothetical protein
MTTPPRSPDPTVIEHNLELARAFITAQLEHPEQLAEIPAGEPSPTVILLPDDDPELAAYNLQLGLRAIKDGRNVYFRHVAGQVGAYSA